MINTAEITHKELQAAREAAGLHQYQVAALLSVSEDTVSRWERGLYEPTPDQVDELEKVYKAPGLWYGWMRWKYKSFRDRFPEHPKVTNLVTTMVEVACQMEDIKKRQETVIRDALDGKIDNEKDFAEYIREAKEAHAALSELLARAEGGHA